MPTRPRRSARDYSRAHALRLGLVGLVLALLSASALSAAPAKPAAVGKQVLFVCTGNFYRSRFAEIAFNTLVHAHGWTAISRGLGTAPMLKPPISPLIPAELARRNVPETTALTRAPLQLTQTDLDHADLVILLDRDEHEPMLNAKFPEFPKKKLRSWSVQDAPKMAPAAAFDAMWLLVEALVAELAK